MIKTANLFPYDQTHISPKILFQRNAINKKFQDMGKATTVVCMTVNKSLCHVCGIFLENNMNTPSGKLPLIENCSKAAVCSS